MRKIIFTFLILFMFVSTAHSTDIGGDADVYGGLTTDVGSIGSGKGDSTINGTLDVTGAFGALAITGTSFIIGLDTLDTTEWGYLDGLNQSVSTTDGVTFTTIAGTAVTGTSFIIGSDTLDTNEWGFLDGLNQSVGTGSGVTFTTIGGTAITGTSFVIGGNTLEATEWGFLDGQDQAVKSASNVTFGTIGGTTITGSGTVTGQSLVNTGATGGIATDGSLTGISLDVTTGSIDGGDITGTNVNTTNASMITDGTITGTSLTVGAGAIDGGDITGTNVNTTNASMITDGTVTGVSFDIGGNSLTTTEWAYLDGQDQSVSTGDNVAFLTIDGTAITGSGELTLTGASDRITNEETGDYIDMASDGQVTFDSTDGTAVDMNFDFWTTGNLADGPDIYSNSNEVGIRNIVTIPELRVGIDDTIIATEGETVKLVSVGGKGTSTGVNIGYEQYITVDISPWTPVTGEVYSTPYTEKQWQVFNIEVDEDGSWLTNVPYVGIPPTTTLAQGEWTHNKGGNILYVRGSTGLDPTGNYVITVYDTDEGRRLYADGTALNCDAGFTFHGAMNVSDETPSINFEDTDTANAYGALGSNDGDVLITADTLNVQSGSEIRFNVDSSGPTLYTPIERMSIDENSVDLATGMDLIITDMAGSGVDDVCVDNNGLIYSSDTACVGGGSESTTVSDTAEVDLTLTTFDITADLKDDSIVEARLDISNTPTDTYILQYKDATDKLTWIANAGGGTVTSSGTPLVNRLPYFTTDTNITGTTNATLDASGNLAAVSVDTPTLTTTGADLDITAKAGQDIIVKLGDLTGDNVNKIIFTDSNDELVAYISSRGNWYNEGSFVVRGNALTVGQAGVFDTIMYLTQGPTGTAGHSAQIYHDNDILRLKSPFGDVAAILGDNIGGDAFEVWDGDDALVASIDSDGNVVIDGSLTVTNGVSSGIKGSDISDEAATTGWVLTASAGTEAVWQAGGGGGVDTSGSPLANYMTYFSDLDTITGTANATVDSSGNITTGGAIIGKAATDLDVQAADGQDIIIQLGDLDSVGVNKISFTDDDASPTEVASITSAGDIVAAGDVTVGGAGSDTLITLSNDTTITAVSTSTIGLTGLVQFIGGTNNCIITVDTDDTCDAGTAMVVDNSIALCAVCAAN